VRTGPWQGPNTCGTDFSFVTLPMRPRRHGESWTFVSYTLTQKAKNAIAPPSMGELFGCQLDLCCAVLRGGSAAGRNQLFGCQLDLCCAVWGGRVGGGIGSTLRVRGVLLQRSNVTELISSAQQPLPVPNTRTGTGVVRLPPNGSEQRAEKEKPNKPNRAVDDMAQRRAADCV